ncbi:Putative uncharacterized protein [Lactococcus lactis subsp. lactis A12]|uniref:Uncharacterized protein n=1 Tax=Lactococcus lactis subsp. lactis A12 TaxID=1137134 RepID=S6F2F0_LACLL|nr:Putative uncharacterized protein [Lactococcus lactis subsp. lactis A12]SBW29305.1 Hypothetical protein LLA12_00125 [Lactococcus lactis subsp. lactis]
MELLSTKSEVAQGLI